MQTIVVLGGSYGGKRAFELLSAALPDARVLVIERQSHFNHVYVFPRCCVLPGHEHKAFIPYPTGFSIPPSSSDSVSGSASDSASAITSSASLLPSASASASTLPATSTSTASTDNNSLNKHALLQAEVLALTSTTVTLSRAFPAFGIPTPTIHFDFLVYALGSVMPKPLRMPPGHVMKPQGIAWMKQRQEEIAAARNIVIVGGGALGIQCATDIKHIYPSTHTVTLIHSRDQLLPKFSRRMHDVVMARFAQLGIRAILSDRLCSTQIMPDQTIQTLKGETMPCDLILLCTGQKPNTFLASNSVDQDFAHCVDPYTSLLKVNKNLQLITYVRPDGVQDNRCAKREDCVCFPAPPPMESGAANLSDKKTFTNIYAVGDAADCFDAIKAGHTSYYQAQSAARNIIACINGGPLEEYKSGLKSIKLTLGLGQSVVQKGEDVVEHFNGAEDLDAHLFWPAGREVNLD